MGSSSTVPPRGIFLHPATIQRSLHVFSEDPFSPCHRDSPGPGVVVFVQLFHNCHIQVHRRLHHLQPSHLGNKFEIEPSTSECQLDFCSGLFLGMFFKLEMKAVCFVSFSSPAEKFLVSFSCTSFIQFFSFKGMPFSFLKNILKTIPKYIFASEKDS